MKTWKKVLIGVGAVRCSAPSWASRSTRAGRIWSRYRPGKAQKQNLSSVVSASGEIKPKTYVNIGANAFGKIIKLQR